MCCTGSNRRLIVVPLLFPELRRVQKHRTLSTSIGLTACPLSFLSRLRVLYLCWAVFTPLPSCVGCVSTTSPCANVVSTASPLANYTSTIPGSIEHLRSLEYCACNLNQRVYHLSSYRLLHQLPSLCRLFVRVDYSFVSTTSPRVNYLLMSTTPYISILGKYSALWKISTMSTGYGPRILGRCGPTHSNAIRDSGPQETGGGNLAMHPRSLDSSWRG